METDISPETYELLKASGWSPDRAVDSDPIVNELDKKWGLADCSMRSYHS